MKFSHRLVGLGVVVVLLVFIYLLLSDDILPEVTVRSGFLSMKVLQKKQHSAKFDPNADVCQFSERLIPKNGIHTMTLFDNVAVNDGMLPVRFQPEGKKKKSPANPQPLRVFLIPHSHNDPGWLKTLNRYFIDQTKEILDNMVVKMNKYKDMTFVWSETVFLSIWWKELSDEAKATVRKFIEEERLEIVTGGWVDPDEASTHYVDILDQMMEGHRWLEKHLNVKPEVYWTPDPFGYSPTMPFIVNRAGFKRMVMLRIHDDVKAQLRDKQNLEFFWRQTWDRANMDTDMFTHLLPYNLYSIKHSCGPDPYVCLMFDFRRIPGEYSEANAPTLTEGNIDTYARYLVDQFRAKSLHYRQNVIFFPLGDDFRYDRPIEWDQQYTNYKLLFDHINKQKDWNVHATFGTPSKYFRTLESDNRYLRPSTPPKPNPTKPKYPVLYGDFYPYMDNNEEFWTGFYTTRPFWKGLARELQADIRGAEILNSLAAAYAKYKTSNFQALVPNMGAMSIARKALALFQHHDAVTGTSKPDVVLDYGDRLWRAKKLTQRVKLTAASYLLSAGKVQMNSTMEEGQMRISKYVLDIDDARNSDSLEPSKTIIPTSYEGTKVIFFNSIGHGRSSLVRIRVDTISLLVMDNEGNSVNSQIMPVWRDNSNPRLNDYELVFYAEIPAFGFRTYTVKKIREKMQATYLGRGLATVASLVCSDSVQRSWTKLETYNPGDEIKLQNSYFTAYFDKEWGLLHSLKMKDGKEVRTDIRFLSYTSSRSGAYLFYPTGKATDKQFMREPGVSPVIITVKGPLVSEVRVIWNYLVHTATVYHSTAAQAQGVELENCLDMSGDSNFFLDKEVIMRVYNDVKHGDIFYTDLNGYQMRRRKFRENFHIAGNYYPMTTMSYVQDNTTRLSILSRQSHGVSSQRPGWLEVMLDRKLSFDDNRGLGEGVQDNLPTLTKFYLLVESTPGPRDDELGKNSYPSLLAHQLSNLLLYPVTNFYQLVFEAPYKSVFEPMKVNLPCDLHIVNFKTMFSPKDRSLLEVAFIVHKTGFQCQFVSSGLNCTVDKGDVAFSDLFTDLEISHVKEKSLSLMYTKNTNLVTNSVIEVDPMDMAAFLLTFR